ncbi:hypothetical protein M758_3G185800 [Ceratodon purpureus]|nr:hypothetical protein M758_3G185800 [Ceratodon purpureus]
MEESATWEIESMWSNLPIDILERVFTFLPIASVCRFRTVSKSWNRLITSHAFGHAQASNVSPEEYLLIAVQRSWVYRNIWYVLDVTRRRFLTFNDKFLTNHLQRQGLIPFNQHGPSLLATAGGLFCMKCMYYKTYISTYFVCNSVLKTIKQIPHLVVSSGTHDHVTMMYTDRVSMEYEIFVVNIHLVSGHSQPHSIFVYESKTGNWRQAPYKPLNPPVNYPTYKVWWDTLTIFRNQHYCIAEKGSRGGIVSYDKETGEVSDLAGIDIPLAPRSHLLVSKDMLFCVIPIDDDFCDFPSVEIFEINIAKMESILLTEMPQDLLHWVLGHDLEHRFCIMQCKIAQSAGSILICNLVGRYAAYSLSEKSWYKYLDDHNLVKPYYQAGMTSEALCISSYCLSLCPP